MELSAWVCSLDDDELASLAGSLRGGRIGPGATTGLLRSYNLPEAWAAPLARLAADGLPASMLTGLVDVAQRERQRRPSPIDLVCTRPNDDRVDVVDTAVAVRRLFAQAKREVLIAGFRITERDMLEPLRRPVGRELAVRLFVDIDPGIDALGRKQLPWAEVDAWPAAWWAQFRAEVWPTFMPPPEAWFAPSSLRRDAAGWRSMHAKVIVVDRAVWFVSSANFTERGHTRNLEVGAVIDDASAAERVLAAFDEWTSSGVFQRLGSGAA